MFGEKQEQSVESGSTAMQAARDINVYGLSVSDVRELCALFLKQNFPKLREEANRVAEENVRAFGFALEERIIAHVEKIQFEKLSDPDVQAAINDAVLASARRGAAANPSVLCSLLAERMAKESDDYKDMVLSEAISVVAKLNAEQIALLSYVHFVRKVIFSTAVHVAQLEEVGITGLKFSPRGFGLSASKKQHLEYVGVASNSQFFRRDIYEVLLQEYKGLGFVDASAFKLAVEQAAPSYAKLLEAYTAENLFFINLTSVGEAIALANIIGYIPYLDFKIWLN